MLLSKQLQDGSSVHETSDIEGDVSVALTRCDDHLWPILLAYNLATEIGVEYLNEQVPLLLDDLVSKGKSISVWQHLMLAISFAEKHKGTHNLLLTLHGDWNDIIGKFSPAMQGESVFASQQYVYLLGLMQELAGSLGYSQDLKNITIYKKQMEDALSKSTWAGDRWIRCFKDDGTPVGVESDKYGKIWLNSQTWAVISNTGTHEQRKVAMDSVNKYLDTNMGLAKLYPGFESYPIEDDPFSSYNPGCGENGAVFCHAHTWGVIAEALLGNGERSWKYYTDLLPFNCIEKVGLELYKCEPYAFVSSILAQPNSKAGQGNVSHITGTAAWMDTALRKYILGFNAKLNGIELNPCVPSSWKEFSYVHYYQGKAISVIVKNPNGKQSGVANVTINGQNVNGNFIDSQLLTAKTEIVITM